MDKTITNILNNIYEREGSYISFVIAEDLYILNNNTLICFDYYSFIKMTFELFKHSTKVDTIFISKSFGWRFSDKYNNTLKVIYGGRNDE